MLYLECLPTSLIIIGRLNSKRWRAYLIITGMLTSITTRMLTSPGGELTSSIITGMLTSPGGELVFL